MNGYLASYVLPIGFKKMFRKWLKILNQQMQEDPNFFCFFYWRYGLFTTYLPFSSWRWRTQSQRGMKMTQNWKFWPLTLIYYLHQRGPIKFALDFDSK